MKSLLDHIDYIEDPLMGWCIPKQYFIDMYSDIYSDMYFEINLLNTTELRFKDDKLKNKFYNLMVKHRLGPTFDEVCTSEYTY